MRWILLFLPVLMLAQSKSWKPPRTPDGQVDLQGIWTNATATTLERPAALGGKEFFTPEEAAAYERQRLEATNVDRPEARRAGDPGSYNQFWFDRGTKVVKSMRTSQIADPPDGKVPALTPAAQAKLAVLRADAAAHPADGPEDRLLTERCILFGGAGPPMLVEPYNSNYQIVQSPGYITILMELNHEVRVIPLDRRPHLADGVRQWSGNSRGAWDGDTLVVTSTGFRHGKKSRFGVAYDGMTDENLRVIERFTRVDPEIIVYRTTIEDPTIYTRPWTVELTFSKRKEMLYEYACHEGNYGMFGILEGARAEERKR